MWKAVIADDERIIVKGLRKLVDWGALGITVVGEAGDGQQLMQVIEETQPDIVLSDIRMPGHTGLEVLRWYEKHYTGAKFIFASGFQEFSYAKEALRHGAVDYLLKPVGRRDLETALKKATQQLKEQDAADLFREETNEIQEIFRQINDGRDFEYSDLYDLFRREHWDLDNSFFVGICGGIRPDVADLMSQKNFAKYNLLRFSVFNQLAEAFSDQKLGFVVRKSENCIYFVGVFPKADRESYCEKYIRPLKQNAEDACHLELCIGVGTPAESAAQILDSYRDAKNAFSLYFFEEKTLVLCEEAVKPEPVLFEQYQQDVEEVFKSILFSMHSLETALNRVMQDIYSMHYGNENGLRMRTMSFSGDLNLRLHQCGILRTDVMELQRELEDKIHFAATYEALKLSVIRFYQDTLKKARSPEWSGERTSIEKVKTYIRDNYANDLSIAELADVACVSKNYFSAMFKREAGQNYKAYLTEIRMEKAVELLCETETRVYEIAEKVGYNNVRRFVDAFREKYDLTPIEYREKMRKI